MRKQDQGGEVTCAGPSLGGPALHPWGGGSLQLSEGGRAHSVAPRLDSTVPCLLLGRSTLVFGGPGL